MNRSKLEITAEILRACSMGPQNKTHITYLAFISYEQADIYLARLAQDGLLDRSLAGYTFTPRGSLFLTGYDALISLAPSLRGGSTIRREVLA